MSRSKQPSSECAANRDLDHQDAIKARLTIPIPSLSLNNIGNVATPSPGITHRGYLRYPFAVEPPWTSRRSKDNNVKARVKASRPKTAHPRSVSKYLATRPSDQYSVKATRMHPQTVKEITNKPLPNHELVCRRKRPSTAPAKRPKKTSQDSENKIEAQNAPSEVRLINESPAVESTVPQDVIEPITRDKTVKHCKNKEKTVHARSQTELLDNRHTKRLKEIKYYLNQQPTPHHSPRHDSLFDLFENQIDEQPKRKTKESLFKNRRQAEIKDILAKQKRGAKTSPDFKWDKMMDKALKTHARKKSESNHKEKKASSKKQLAKRVSAKEIGLKRKSLALSKTSEKVNHTRQEASAYRTGRVNLREFSKITSMPNHQLVILSRKRTAPPSTKNSHSQSKHFNREPKTCHNVLLDRRRQRKKLSLKNVTTAPKIPIKKRKRLQRINLFAQFHTMIKQK